MFSLAKRVLMKIPSAPLSIRALASIFLPVTLPINSTGITIEGVRSFLVSAGILSSLGYERGESIFIVMGIGVGTGTTPPNDVVGE